MEEAWEAVRWAEAEWEVEDVATAADEWEEVWVAEERVVVWEVCWEVVDDDVNEVDNGA